jgi:hypothetical protein
MKRQRLVVLMAVLASLVLATNVAARPILSEGQMGNKRTVAAANIAGFDKQHGPHAAFECTVLSGGANTNLDCDDPFPNNEPDVEANPANAQNISVSSNDYGSCCDQYYTTLNGGASWSTGNMSIEKPVKIGSDPVTTFDRRHGMTIHSSLSYSVSHAHGTQACDGDVLVSPSRDGGLTWLKPVIVDDGVGCDFSKSQLFNDKEWIVTDNYPSSPHYGRTYLTWAKFLSHYGTYLESPIFESHSDDGGFTWSVPHEISGANGAICTLQADGPSAECDQDQGASPTVSPDGTVRVAFINEQNASLQESGETAEDQYLFVKSTNGGASWSSPRFIVGMEDGSRDYPLNVDDRQTLTGYQLRVWGVGNMVASPLDGTLYLVFSDNRNGVHNAAHPVTNTDVFLMVSTNGGTSWSGPLQVDAGAGDQWFPWVDVDPTNGTIGILYHDRGASNGDLYSTALAQGTPGSLVKTTVSANPSNPVNSVFFKAHAEGCDACATFHGDYIGLSYGSDGVANAAWTDMSVFSAELGGYQQFIFFARK